MHVVQSVYKLPFEIPEPPYPTLYVVIHLESPTHGACMCNYSVYDNPINHTIEFMMYSLSPKASTMKDLLFYLIRVKTLGIVK